jgi:putative sterol carrier protein
MDIRTILNDFARAFEKKTNKDYFIRLQYEIQDEENGIWQIEVNNGKITIYNEEKIIPEETFVLSKDTLVKLYNNELSPLTAFAQEPNEKGEMCSLIELKNKTEEKKIYLDKKPQEDYLKFIGRLHQFNNFFSKDYPTKIVVDKENGKILHNVNAIGLHSKFNGEKRILHVYFSIKKDEILNEPNFEFSVYVLNGRGVINIGDEEYPIEAKNYYYMQPKDNLCIKNKSDELLEILYLSNT